MNNTTSKQKSILYFTLPIAVLIVFCSGIGAFEHGFYSRETADWMYQCVGQDFSNLFFVVPALVISAFFAAKGNRIAKIIWAGTMITNIYSYMIYCFAVHFNSLFHFYCAILGLSVYALIHFAMRNTGEDFKAWFSESVGVKPVGILLLVIVAVFYFMWFSQSLPAVLAGTVPASVTGDGLLTNPVHALDFAFFLPLLVLSAILLLKKRILGFFLAPMMLVFGITTNVNIISLTAVTMIHSTTNGLPLIIVFTVFTLLCLTFLCLFLRQIKKPA